MTRSIIHQPNPKLDLVLERIVDVPRELVWMAWTAPEHLKKWFTPVPWTTVDCEIDLRPRGIFHTVMRSPEGQEFLMGISSDKDRRPFMIASTSSDDPQVRAENPLLPMAICFVDKCLRF